MSIVQLIVKALADYPFREAAPGESGADYLRALAAHVEQHDFAMAHELRLGRAQADWTPDEINAFRDRMLALPRMRRGVVTKQLMLGTESGHFDTTDAAMRVILTEFMTMFREWRIERPNRDLAPHIAALMMNGQLFSAPIHRRDRYGSLKMLTQNAPCYGWVIVMDAFLHEITESQKAIKHDVILAHVGTRTMRIVARQNYRYDQGRPVFEPDIVEWDLRDQKDGMTFEDPYADLLVSIPETGSVS
jgi:hypothetical protein